jgi:hypothetical protein
VGLRQVWDGVSSESVDRHGWLVDAKGRGGVCWLTRGQAEAWDGVARVQRFRRGQVVGLDGALGHGALPVRAVSDDLRVRRLSRAEFSRRVSDLGLEVEAQALLLDQLKGRSARLSQSLADLTRQSFPGGRAVYEPVPYTAPKVRAWAFLVRPSALPRVGSGRDGVACMPPGVDTTLDLPWVLLATQYEGFSSASGMGGIRYGELSLMAPARVGLSPVMAQAWLFPDNLMALFAGREIYGLPKMYGHTVLDRHSGSSPRGRVALRTQWGTAVDLPYTAHSMPRLDEGPLAAAWQQLHEAVPALVRAREDVNALIPGAELPDDLKDPRRAWPMLFQSVARGEGARRELVDSLLHWLYVDLVGWKRLYSTQTTAASGPGWKGSQFLTDRVVGSRIRPLSIDVGSIALLQVDDTVHFPPEGPHQRPLLRILPELMAGRLGLYYELSAKMEQGPGALVDFQSLYGGGGSTYPPILDWGPAIWRAFGWLDDDR